MHVYHTAVIGAGAGGMTVAVSLSKAGKDVVLLERHQVGGDCTNVGCIPSKTLIHLSREAAQQGHSPKQVLERVRHRRDELRVEETEWLGNLKGITLKFGEARFISPETLALWKDGELVEQIRAHNIVIATGARPLKIPIDGLPPEDYLTNETVFELEHPPQHLAIVGAGVIGVELAFAFRALGSQVTLIDGMERVLGNHEPEASEVIESCLKEAGVDLRLGALSEDFDKRGRSLKLKVSQEIVKVPKVDKVLVAVGRRPNLELDLDRVGITFSKAGIETDQIGYTGVGRIFAIGDVNLNSAFTHSANHQGRRLFKKLLFPFFPTTSEPDYPSVVFSAPEVAQVGPSLRELQQRCRSQVLKSVRVDLKDTDRAYTSGLKHGFVLLHAVRLTGRILSATIVAPNAGEMLPLLTYAVNNKVSLYKLSDQVFPYPTLAEAIKKAADQFVVETLGNAPRELGSYLLNRWRSPERPLEAP